MSTVPPGPDYVDPVAEVEHLDQDQLEVSEDYRQGYAEGWHDAWVACEHWVAQMAKAAKVVSQQ